MIACPATPRPRISSGPFQSDDFFFHSEQLLCASSLILQEYFRATSAFLHLLTHFFRETFEMVNSVFERVRRLLQSFDLLLDLFLHAGLLSLFS